MGLSDRAYNRSAEGKTHHFGHLRQMNAIVVMLTPDLRELSPRGIPVRLSAKRSFVLHKTPKAERLRNTDAALNLYGRQEDASLPPWTPDYRRASFAFPFVAETWR